jgi:hypothetical protein
MVCLRNICISTLNEGDSDDDDDDDNNNNNKLFVGLLLLLSSLIAIRWAGHTAGMSDKKDIYRNIYIAASKEIGLEVNADGTK